MSWFKTLRRWWLEKIWWKVTGYRANKQIKPGGKKRDEAEEQLARILFETGMRPDAVGATTMNGAPCFLVTHKTAKECFIDRTYTAAADEVIAWFKRGQGAIEPQRNERAPVMNRKQRRRYQRNHRRKIK